MKTKLISYVSLMTAAFIIMAGTSCTKLEQKLGAGNSIAPVDAGGAPTPPSISAVYGQLNQLVGQYGYQAMQEHSTDELMGPTRGTDWDDFGTWRRLHLHTWGPDHNQVNDVWNGLNGALFQSTLVAETASGLPKAEAQFLWSFFRFLVIDLYGQMQSRPATAKAREIPAVVPRAQAIDQIIAELESAVAGLPAFNGTNRHLATKEAAWALLAKLYLNKAVYKQSLAAPAGPFTFAPGDMNKVIEYCNNIDNNPALQLNPYYWDNFTWKNGANSTENIFVRRNSDGINMRWATSMGYHYYMAPGGWNGFTTLSNFYDSFEGNDIRKTDTIKGDITISGADPSVYYPGSTTTSSYIRLVGSPAGLLVGSVKGPINPAKPKEGGSVGNKVGQLFDRSGNPLILTPNASIFFNGEVSGIRTNKFPLDPLSLNDGAWGSPNDFPFFRFADVRLMKAEAILRGGSDPETPLQIINEIKSRRNAPTLTSVNLEALQLERRRELYLEGWRRNDMIRFGIFNAPVQERPNESAATKVVYPIPTIALSSNPNLKQNAGY